MTLTAHFLQRLLLVVASFCLLSSAHASSVDQDPGATTYVVQNGVLMDVNNLEYNGKFYDVSFVTGSCNSVFSGCNPASTVFGGGTQNNLVGVNAATALAEAMFYYDQSAPAFKTVNGCANLSCYIATPTSINTAAGTVGSSAIDQWFIVGQGGLASANGWKNPDVLVDSIVGKTNAASANLPSTETWAVWTPVTSPVPETQTWAMMAAGLVLLAFATRKANQRR